MKIKYCIFLAIILGASLYNANAQNIPMRFENKTLQSIPLSIPGVMNPNLSPMSKSGVSLDVGQEVYFFPNGKSKQKVLLFKVDASWKRDTVLQIHEIIKKRKEELGVK